MPKIATWLREPLKGDPSAPRADGGGTIGDSSQLAAYFTRTQNTLSGAQINSETAMRISVVNACVRILAETVASLPLNMYRHMPEGKERANDVPLDKLLRSKPNNWQTSFEFREMMMGHVVLRGNAYALKIMIAGELVELIPLNPDKMRVEMKNGALLYIYTNPDGRQIPYGPEKIFHLRGFSSDGIKGRSVIEDAREGLGIAMQQDKFEGASYGRGGLKNVILEHPELLDAGAAKRIAESWADKYGGEGGYWKPIVLEEGMKASELTLSASDMQFLESRKFRTEDIARLFRVPPHLIGELGRSTNNNIETQSLEFLTHTIRPWLVRWEQALQRDVIQNDNLFAEHQIDAMVRGDITSRGAYYVLALTNSWMCPDDVRAAENMNPIPGGLGKKFREPANLKDLGAVPAPAPAAPMTPSEKLPAEPAPAQEKP